MKGDCFPFLVVSQTWKPLSPPFLGPLSTTLDVPEKDSVLCQLVTTLF